MGEYDEKDKTPDELSDEQLLERIKSRYETMSEADEENRRNAMEDMKFINVPGYQWEANMKQERGLRPCYEFNKLRISCKRVINDMRANRPQGKVRAVEGGDVDMAELNEGLVRNIWNISDAETVTDYAAEFQVSAGMGAWRVITDYIADDVFEQDIKVEAIQNPFTLYCDPSAKDPLKRDADDWIITEKMSQREYQAKYPDDEESNFSDNTEFDDEDWTDEDSVRVAEYWYKQPVKKELWQIDTGEVVDSTSDEANGIEQERIVKRREVMTNDIMYCMASGQKVLEGPHKWAGTMFPFVVVFGEYMYIDGRHRWWGLPRFAKDAQRSYNIARTAIAETIHQAPKSFMWATVEQAKGQTQQWAEAHKKNLPFMLYNPDPKAGGPPQRMGGADVPVALIQESQLASDEIKAVTGIFEASQGEQGNETSGRAIYARQQQGEIATFNFQDNMAKGVQRTYELVLDLIPNIYDTERELRVLGSDGAEKYEKVNQVVTDYEQTPPRRVRINDITSGKYDVTVDVGPNFGTLRQEAAETYGAMAQQYPELMGLAGDLVFKSMDLPYAEDIADRIKTMLPPQIQQMMNEDKELPPEVMQAMQQAEAAMAQVQEYGQLVQAAAAELEQEKSEATKIKASVDVAIANLRADKAEFEADMATESANLIKQGADLTKKSAEVTKAATEAGQTLEAAEDAVTGLQAFETAERIDDVLAQFMQAADSALGDMKAQAAELDVKASRSPIGGKTRREGGKLVADVEFDDGSVRSIAAVRGKDGLTIVTPDSEAESEAEIQP